MDKQNDTSELSDLKCVIVIDHTLSRGQAANRAAVLTSGIMNLHPEMIGRDIVTKDGHKVNAISRVPIPILMTGGDFSFFQTIKEAEQGGCQVVLYFGYAQGLRSYKAYEEYISDKELSSLDIDGILLYGPKKRVNRLTGRLPMLK